MIDQIDHKSLYDAIVIGGGPAGLSAAIYMARAQYRVLVIEKEQFGGQIRITSEVVNYPGILETSGEALSQSMRQQAQRFGAEFLLAEVTRLDVTGELKVVETPQGKLYAYGVIMATGAQPRKVGFEGETEFQGRGVAYCATCDGEFFTDLDVFVVGGGYSAAEEAIFLTKYARKVTVLVRKGQFACAASVAEACLNHPKIEVKFHTEIERLEGDTTLKRAILKQNQTGEYFTYEPTDRDGFGVFVFAGYTPQAQLLEGQVALNDQGYIITDHQQCTSVPGVYAAGDICIKPLRQVVTAVSDGAIAATELEKHVAACQAKTGIKPDRPTSVQPVETPVAASASHQQATASDFLTPDIQAQLKAISEKFEQSLILKVYADARPISKEVVALAKDLAELCPKLSAQIFEDGAAESVVAPADRPYLQVCLPDGQPSGYGFHGMPGGHEFQSFVISLYNAAGPGQVVEEAVATAAKSLPGCNIKLLVSLSCTQCPDLVVAAGRLATLNPKLDTQVYDINHFEAIKKQYNVMSVPCIVINDGEKVAFGKKSVAQLLELYQSL